MAQDPEIRRYATQAGRIAAGWVMVALSLVPAGAVLWSGVRGPGGLTAYDAVRAFSLSLLGGVVSAMIWRRSRFGIEITPRAFRSIVPGAEWQPWSTVHDIRYGQSRQTVTLLDHAGQRLAVLPLFVSRFDEALNDVVAASPSAAAALTQPLPATLVPASPGRMSNGVQVAMAALGLPLLTFWVVMARMGTRAALIAALAIMVCVVVALFLRRRHNPQATTIDRDGITVQRGQKTTRIGRGEVHAVALRRRLRSAGRGSYDLDVVVVDGAGRATSISTYQTDPIALFYTARSIAHGVHAPGGHPIA